MQLTLFVVDAGESQDTVVAVAVVLKGENISRVEEDKFSEPLRLGMMYIL